MSWVHRRTARIRGQDSFRVADEAPPGRRRCSSFILRHSLVIPVSSIGFDALARTACTAKGHTPSFNTQAPGRWDERWPSPPLHELRAALTKRAAPNRQNREFHPHDSPGNSHFPPAWCALRERGAHRRSLIWRDRASARPLWLFDTLDSPRNSGRAPPSLHPATGNPSQGPERRETGTALGPLWDWFGTG